MVKKTLKWPSISTTLLGVRHVGLWNWWLTFWKSNSIRSWRHRAKGIRKNQNTNKYQLTYNIPIASIGNPVLLTFFFQPLFFVRLCYSWILSIRFRPLSTTVSFWAKGEWTRLSPKSFTRLVIISINVISFYSNIIKLNNFYIRVR